MSGLGLHGLSTVCETCDSDIDFPDDAVAERGICHQCGEAFLLDAPTTTSIAHSA